LKPLETFAANFANYSYGRGYHYFFNLDTFPRVEGSPSYALDDKNRFNHTFSHDEEWVNGTQLKNIINRTYVGLPISSTTNSSSKSRDKNVCHFNLFNIEDKKYHNNRLISKLKYVLKHLKKLNSYNKLTKFSEFKKDYILS
jgi:hypothetical protein